MKKLFNEIFIELKEHKSTFIVYSIMRLLVLIIAILQFLNKNYEQVFFCILTLLLMIVPSFIQATFKISMPSTLEIILLFFIFAAEILGEMDHYYLKYEWLELDNIEKYPLWPKVIQEVLKENKFPVHKINKDM